MGSNKELKLKIIYKPIGSIIGYVNNTRVHPQDQIDQIKSSISEFGMCTPIGIHNNSIVYGHGRHEALKQLGYEEIPTLDLSHLTDAQRKAFIIADNKIGDNSEFDLDLLKVEIEALHEMDFNIDLLGFSMEELEDLDINFGEPDMTLDESKADDVPELVENPVIKLGDLIELGHNYQHRLLCGDSTSEDNLNKLIRKDVIDLLLTDPPYGMNLDTNYEDIYSNAKSKTSNQRKVIGDNEYFDPTFLFNLSKEVFLWGADYFCQSLPVGGSWIVWDKKIGDGKIGNEFELCWSKQKHKKFLIENEWAGFRGMKKEDGKRVHPTQKPIELLVKIIEDFSKNNSIVLDLFLGSGSTLIASENLSRYCYGMELDEKYAQVIIQRYVDYTSNPMIKINGQEVAWHEYKEKNSVA